MRTIKVQLTESDEALLKKVQKVLYRIQLETATNNEVFERAAIKVMLNHGGQRIIEVFSPNTR